MQNPKNILNAKNTLHLCQSAQSLWVDAFNRILDTALAARGTVWLFLFIQFSIKRLRDLVFIPVKLIKQAHQEDWLRSLAYFVRMKSLYVNNTHYGYNLRSLGSKLGVTPATLSFHIKELTKRGLIEKHAGNITFKGYRPLRALFGANFIGVPINHKDQLSLVRAQLIRFNLKQQAYIIKKSGVQKCPTLKQISERMKNGYTGLSAVGFGRVLRLSPSRGAALRSDLIKSGVLSYKRRFEVLRTPPFPPQGGTPPAGVLRTALRTAKIQGAIPQYAFIKDGQVLVQKRMELHYEGIS